MKTRVFGEQTDTVIIETTAEPGLLDDVVETRYFIIPAADSIVKLWFSDGTILGIKYGKDSKLYPNTWSIRILNKGTENNYIYRQCFKETLLYYSDEYETKAELVNHKVIPRSKYAGDDL